MPESTTGAFSDALLRATLDNHLGVGADKDQPDEVRFLRGVRRVVQKRLLTDDSDEVPCVFTLHTAGELPPGAERVGMIDYGDKPLGGRVWCVGPNLGFARAVTHPCGMDDGALFEFLEEIGRADVPAVVYLPASSKDTVRFYPSGVVEEDTFEILSVVERPVSLEDVLEALDRLYENQLVTPIAQSTGVRLWSDPDRFRPVSNAELIAQSYVATALWARFFHCRVAVEGNQTSGRFDVAILGRDLSATDFAQKCYVVLELKVLRSYGVRGGVKTDKNNRDWISSGVDQAHSYAQDMHADAKALCCFDMRESDTGEVCFAHVAARAAGLGVSLKRWYLYGRLADYRAQRGDAALESATA